MQPLDLGLFRAGGSARSKSPRERNIRGGGYTRRAGGGDLMERPQPEGAVISGAEVVGARAKTVCN